MPNGIETNSQTLKDEVMKISVITTVAALIFGIANSAQAIEPYTTAYGGWGTTSSYYVPSTSVYTTTPVYSGSSYYSSYPGYVNYPQYTTTQYSQYTLPQYSNS